MPLPAALPRPQGAEFDPCPPAGADAQLGAEVRCAEQQARADRDPGAGRIQREEPHAWPARTAARISALNSPAVVRSRLAGQ